MQRVALISGGASSIGADISKAFAAEGYQVVVADIDKVSGEAIAQAIANVHFVETNLLDDESIARAVDKAASLGKIGAVIHAACSYKDRGLTSDRADWNESLGVNVVGGAMLVRAAVPSMAQQASVVLISSISAKVAQAGRWLYPTGKAALLQLTRSMAMDLAEHGIRVNSLSLGKTWSRLLSAKHKGDRAAGDEVEGRFHMLGRLADGEEVAKAALFLCSDSASFITAADLPVDGGFSALGPEARAKQFLATTTK